MKKWLGFSGILVLILTLGPLWGLRGQAPAGGEELQPVVESFYEIAPGRRMSGWSSIAESIFRFSRNGCVRGTFLRFGFCGRFCTRVGRPGTLR